VRSAQIRDGPADQAEFQSMRQRFDHFLKKERTLNIFHDK
jgi:hypothetical protein